MKYPIQLIAVMALTLGACDREPLATKQTAIAGGIHRSVASARDHSAVYKGMPDGPETSIDHEFWDIAQAIPGFGGWRIGSDQNSLIVYATNTVDTGRMGAALQPYLAKRFFAPGRTLADLPIIFRVTPRSFDVLMPIRLRVRDLGRIDQITRIGIDVDRGIVTVGVANSGLVQEIANLIESTGTPRESFVITVKEPIRPMADLYGVASWIRAGYRQTPTDWFDCTIGGLVGAAVTTQYVALHVLTGSHCSRVLFGLDTATVGQPNPSFNILGVEDADVATYTCSSGGSSYDCRNSDAALIGMPTGTIAISGFAEIQGTNDPQPDSGGIDLGPVLSIGARITPYVGLELDKVGTKTGWTYGEVTEACEDVSVTYPNHSNRVVRLLCQTTVSGGTGPGDSGAGVFKQYGDRTYDSGVAFAGILWGGSSSFFIFARTARIEMDLGTLNIY